MTIYVQMLARSTHTMTPQIWGPIVNLLIMHLVLTWTKPTSIYFFTSSQISLILATTLQSCVYQSCKKKL